MDHCENYDKKDQIYLTKCPRMPYEHGMVGGSACISVQVLPPLFVLCYHSWIMSTPCVQSSCYFSTMRHLSP